ncbi:MAG: NUDIX domain-containing protein [Thermoplasmata archaeon]|nr:MAG: NUDIX domain-containing protein [Thermoplasmata archaeon]
MTKLNAKGWIEKNGKFIVGEGRAQILRLIDQTHSLSKAAEKMKMSYRHLWGTIREMEEDVGKQLVVSSRGGRGGGKTELTKTGKKLLLDYTKGITSLQEFLDNQGFLKPSLSVDGIIIHKKKLVLIKRANSPFKGKYALPGGFVEYNERVEDAVVREIQEETGLKTEIESLIGVYSDPKRDPRGHTVSVVYEMRVKGGKLKSGSDAKEAKLFSMDEIPKLAFDHDVIVGDYLRKEKNG